MDRFVGISTYFRDCICIFQQQEGNFSKNNNSGVCPSGIACGVCFKNASGQKYVPRNWDVYPEDFKRLIEAIQSTKY